MRTSLVEIKRIDSWLLGADTPQDALVMEAWLALDESLKDKVKAQKTAHDLIKYYGRQKLKNEIKAVESELLTSTKHRSFQDRIKSIFSI